MLNGKGRLNNWRLCGQVADPDRSKMISCEGGEEKVVFVGVCASGFVHTCAIDAWLMLTKYTKSKEPKGF